MPSGLTAIISAAAAKAQPNPQLQPQVVNQANVASDAAKVAQATQAQVIREQGRVNESRPTIQVPSRVERNEKGRRAKRQSEGEDKTTRASAAPVGKDKIDLVA